MGGRDGGKKEILLWEQQVCTVSDGWPEARKSAL